jgi:AcrR family transcriptional regulator
MATRQSRSATSPAGTGREAQRRRTRAAIVAAATDLIQAGADPSVDDIAAAADVSRRTVYMYFPTLDQLLLDATVGALSSATVERALRTTSTDPFRRVDALVRAVVASAEETLPLGRRIIALTAAHGDRTGNARRGQRRVQWIETALAPLHERLSPRQFDLLVSGLSLVIGWEAMVILRDVRGLDPRREEQTLRWAAAALVRSIVDAADATGPDRSGD